MKLNPLKLVMFQVVMNFVLLYTKVDRFCVYLRKHCFGHLLQNRAKEQLN